MKHMEKLKKMLCKELDEMAEKGELGAGSLEIVHKLTDTIKNIDKIEMLEEDDGMSERGSSYRRSYGRGGEWEANGTYARDGGYSGRRGRGANGRYVSRTEARDDMMSMLSEARMSAEDEREREVIDRAMEQLRNI